VVANALLALVDTQGTMTLARALSVRIPQTGWMTMGMLASMPLVHSKRSEVSLQRKPAASVVVGSVKQRHFLFRK
jgi:hypothetical protein